MQNIIHWIKYIFKLFNPDLKSKFTEIYEKNLCKSRISRSDLIFCRDCLIHLSFQDSIKIIQNFKRSKVKYLLITTFTERIQNIDLDDIFWRLLNMKLSPFNFPAHITMIDAKCNKEAGVYTDKN